MSRKNSLTFRRGATTVIAEGCYAITCVTAMAVTYIIFAPFRLLSQGLSRMTGGLLTYDDD
jgi:hypothetical protein